MVKLYVILINRTCDDFTLRHKSHDRMTLFYFRLTWNSINMFKQVYFFFMKQNSFCQSSPWTLRYNKHLCNCIIMLNRVCQLYKIYISKDDDWGGERRNWQTKKQTKTFVFRKGKICEVSEKRGRIIKIFYIKNFKIQQRGSLLWKQSFNYTTKLHLQKNLLHANISLRL